MKKATFVLLLLSSFYCFGQTNITAILDSVFYKAKQTSMYTSIVNWDSLYKQVHLKAENAKTIQDLKPAFNALLNGMLDKHGSIRDASNYAVLGYFDDYEKLNHPDKRPRDSEMYRLFNDTTLHFSYDVLGDKIGYLKIVTISSINNPETEAKKIRNALIQLSKLNIDKWIVDLRYNCGGNMQPMVTGIAPLIGDGTVGSLTNLSGQKKFDWVIKSSAFYYTMSAPIMLANEPIFNKKPKVAVLTSRYTISSGEIVATCFKGRPNTRFFGEATGGYTTSNNWEVIDDKIIMTISTGIYCDRNGVTYKYNIPVDVEVPFELTNDLEKDKCIIESKKWLKAK